MNLTVDNVHFTYPSGTQALRGVSMQVESGAAVAIIGENGAGKSTLAKHFNGLLRPGSGQVLVGDWNTRDYSVARLAGRVGFVFQNPDDQLLERTVEEEVGFGPRNLKQRPEEVAANVAAALDRVGLTAEAKTHPYDLTASERKLVTLASILAMNTPVLMLDEPTMGQDMAGVRRIGAIIESLKAEGRTVLTISHDIDFCAEYFSRVVVMANGQVLDDGPTAEVLRRRDMLATTNVEPPQMIRLAQALGLDAAPLTPQAFVEARR